MHSFQDGSTFDGATYDVVKTPTRVLLFDALPEAAQVTRMALRQADISPPDYFSDPDAAFGAHSKRPYDLLLIDLPMSTELPPAAKLIRHIRKQEQAADGNPTAYIVAILQDGRKESIKAAVFAGADAVWLKPLSGNKVAELMAKVSSVMAEMAAGADDADKDSVIRKLQTL